MGRTLNRQRSAFVLCLAIGVIGITILSLSLQALTSPSQGGAMAGLAPGLLKPVAVNHATHATPPTMGRNSWNALACDGLHESLVRPTADALVSSCLLAAGYNTLILDDC